MSSSKLSILLVGSMPDVYDSNAVLQGYAWRGFRCAVRDATVEWVPFEGAVTAIRSLRPQLTVIFGGVFLDEIDYWLIREETKRYCGQLVFWLYDDPYEFDRNVRIYPLADAIFTNDRASMRHFPPALPVFHLPLAACPFAHDRCVRPRGGPDLFFCGYGFENRHRLLEEIHRRAQGRLSLTVLGSNWYPARVPSAINMRVSNSEMADCCNSALATLNVGREHNLSNFRYCIRPSTPGPRTFEAAMAGAVQIFIATGLEIFDYFDPEMELLLADSAEDVLSHVLKIKDDPEYGLGIGRAAQARCREFHTYSARARSMLDALGFS